MKEVNFLLGNWTVEQIEKQLIYTYISSNQLNYEQSLILQNYFADFDTDSLLQLKISTLNISSLKKVETVLELLIPPKDRKLNGAFFTPDYVVDFIIQNLTPSENATNLDPSCGCGAFLLGLVKYYQEKFAKPIKQIIQKNIFGCDIMPYNVRRAKLILAIYALENDEIIDNEDYNIIQTDSIRTNWQEIFAQTQGKFDIILGNPPYVKFQDLSDANRKYLLNNWNSIKKGTFNLYFAFFELGYKLLNQNGKLGYITPNNYFTSLAGESLRHFFHQKACVFRIVDFKDKKVFEAQTYTAITFLNKQSNPSILYDKIQKHQVPEQFIKNVNGSPNKIATLNPKKWRLLKSDEQINIHIIETIGKPIGQLFNIAVGIATLKDEIYFVDSPLKKDDFYIKNWEDKVFLIEKNITKVIYKISDFKTQSDIIKNTRRIIFPYKSRKKTVVPYTEDELETQYPHTYQYFQEVQHELVKRDKGKKITPFFAYGRTQGLNRSGQMLLTPTFSQFPRFLIAPEQDAFFCNGYGIYFREEVQSLWADATHPITQRKNIDLAQKILNSCVMDYYVNTTSVSIQGGYPCYQKNFIEKFTIPDFSTIELKTLRALSALEEIDTFLIEKYQLNLPVPNRAS